MSIVIKRTKFFQDVCKLILEMKKQNIEFCPFRFFTTDEEQQKLLKEKKTQVLQSQHLQGLAIDLVLVRDGKVIWERTPEYDQAGALWTSWGHTWGGNWKTLEDIYHFEI